MFEDERQRASWRRHGAIARGVAKRGLVAFLAFAMAFGTTPAQMWAEGAEGIAEAMAQAATAGEGAAADDNAAADADSNGAAAEDGAATGDTAAKAAGNDSATADGAAGAENAAAVASVASEQGEAKAAASAATLSSEAKVYIQDSKDKDSSWSNKSGALKAGDTLWANMYDEVETEDYWGDPTTETKSIANPGTWNYTWLAADAKGYSTADYTQELGREQSLVITGEMAGKYIICKVTVDGKDYYAPASTYDGSFNSNIIPGPVLGTGQMELNSVKLSSDTPSIGDILTATPYKDWSSPAGSDAKVTYTWFASTSSSSGFTKIEGETGATLTVTDNLEGKYIKVEATAGVNTVNKTTSSKVKQAGAVEISAVSIVNIKDNTSVFAVGDTAKARAKEKGGAYGAFVDASKLNYQWQSSDTKSGAYTDIAGATGETLELTDALGGKYLKCKVSSKIGSSSLTNSTGALVAASGSINVTSVTMSPSSGKVEVGSTITATAKAGSTDVTADSHVTWQWCKGTSNYASSCNTPIEGETGNTLTVTAALKGYYVVAKANGGYGEQKPYYAAGPVSVAGQVELYDVQFEGSPATSGVHVGDTLKTKVRKKDGSSYSYIGRTDNVSYQWQYANSSSSYDSAYTDIPGATEATYTVDAAYAGKYLRVKVTSENTVSSTQKKSSYGGTQSVAPLGPVTLKGQYKLAGIELADKNVTLSVGSKITPSVQVPGSWSGSTKDVPDDAELTMAWYASENGTDWTELTDGIDTTDGSLTISDALVGKRIKVTANALDNTVEWVSSDSVTAAGEYNLLRVIANPQINSDSTHLVSGDDVKATVQAKRADGSTTNGIDVTGQATVAWYAADDAKAPEADWTLLSDMSGAEATVSASAAGKYLKAVATSGSSTVELVSANKVIAAGSLEAAVQKLNNANKQIAVDYSAKGGNVNDVLKAQLADLGFTDIDVKISEGGVAFKAGDDKATVGISDAQDKTNGDVTFFYMNPDEYTGYNLDQLRNADVVFELARAGEETEYYQPNKAVKVAWDEDKLQDLLDEAAEQLVIGYAMGDTAESVTQNLTLPYKAGANKKFSVEWKSSDTDALFVSGYGWSDYTGKVARASSDREVALTAKVAVPSNVSDGVKVTGEATHTVTVKGDPEKVAADKKALQEKVDAAFTYDNIKYSGTETVANKDGLTADLQMPRTSTLKIDGKYYEVKYSASTDDITFNGYKGTVYQPLPGAEAAKTKLTLTVTDKSNAEVTASKTLDFAIAPQDQGELDAELFHLSLAKSTFSQGILDGQDASNVTRNLHAPLKVYGQGLGVNWCYSAEEAAGHYGFVFSELPGGTENTYRLLKSSNPRVIAHENLIFTQPEYNTKVTISGRLKSERFARYAERYPDNSDYAVLAGLDVSATVAVLGTSGQAAPEVTTTCSVIGIDADGNHQTWTAAEPYTLKTGSTAADLSEALFKKHGLTADYGMGTWGWYLNSVTSPVDAGRTLGYDSQTGAYWQLFINGTAASVGAGDYTLEAGDSVVWCYSKYGDAAPTDQLSVSCTVIGQDASGAQQTWAQPTTALVEEGATAADLSEQVFKQAGIGADTRTGPYGWFLNSLTSPFNKKLTLSTEQVNESTWKFWQFFVNGKKANVGAGNYTLKAGDKVSWVYGSDGTIPGQTKASLQIIGVDSGGNVQTWAPAADYTMVDTATVADATELAFKQSGISADYGTGAWGWFLNSITSPFDERTLAWDSTTGAYWKLFIDGKPSDLGAGSVKLKDAKSIAWVYTAGDKLPDPDALTTDPNAPKSNFDSAWPAFAGGKANGSVAEVPTPSGAAESAWDEPADIKGDAKGVSDLLIIDGNICAVKGGRIVLIDSETGKKELASCSIGANIGYFCRPAYKDGYLVVPFEDGSLGIFVLDKKDGQYSIACRYKTPSLGIKDTQALTSVTISGGKAYAGFTVVDGSEGALVCVDLASGKVDWTTDKKKSETNENEGYYWAGAAASGDDIIIGNESGKVALIDGSNGKELSSVSVGTPVRSGIIAVEVGENGDGTYLAVSRDNGTLYKIRRSGDKLTLEGKPVAFATISTSTPAVSNGLAYVCGMDIEGYGTLSVIDLSTMSVKKTIRADKGESKSTPLVSVQGNDTYVYFTCNALPGGVYAYKLGDDAAQMIFTPDAKYREYCTASIICDEKGNLYYANDSGRLFKLAGAESWRVAFDAQGGSYVASRYVAKNKMVSEPAAPTRDGYTFLGWYTAEGEKWDFAKDVVTADMTLYAKWIKNAVAPDGNGGSGSKDGSGNGTNGQQAGGAVAPGQKPVSTTTTTETKGNKDSKKNSDKSGKKDKKSDTGSSAATTAKKSAAAPAQQSGFNPLAIVGVAAGVIGLAVIGVFVFTKRR